MIPIVIQRIILDYKQDLEYEDLKINHKIKFKNTLYLLKKLKNINNRYYWDESSNRRTVTIGPMFKNNHTICLCFSICLNCHNYVHSSKMFNLDIAKICKCY
jgi:hypothetical protein